MLKFKSYLMEKKKMPSVSEFNILKHSDIKKNPSRVTLFLQKIKNGEEFLTKTGELVKINQIEYNDFKLGFEKNGFSKLVQTSKGNKQYPHDFLKSGEFGGKGKGSGTRAEDAALKVVQNNLIDVLKKEKDPYITLKIGKRTVQCAAITTTAQTGFKRAPKSDFTVKDTKGNDVAHISHKAGRSSKDFQQYGGITDVPNNSEIQKFFDDVKAKHPDGLPRGTTYFRKITDNDLIQKSIYGVNYKQSTVNAQNCDEFHQGDMTFVKNGTTYSISSSHKGVKGDVPTEGYTAVLVARYQGPTQTYGNKKLKNCRIGIFPKGSLARTAEEI